MLLFSVVGVPTGKSLQARMARWFFEFVTGMEAEAGGFTSVAVLVVPRDTDPSADLLEASLWVIAATQPEDSGLMLHSMAYADATSVVRALLTSSASEGIELSTAHASVHGDHIIATAGLRSKWCRWVNARVAEQLEELRADEANSIGDVGARSEAEGGMPLVRATSLPDSCLTGAELRFRHGDDRA